ncbi:MAG: dTDP-4-dehydrorhamnose 3,5-epimerase [Bacteroidia bacterium]|nr:dTDP-4-dehydrorhamnose 3,5-epimerase [Bacteroidia bacterium]
MIIEKTGIEGLLLLKPKVFKDARGYFFESFNKDFFSDSGIKEEFVQDNQSLSNKNILRGLHFQKPPHAQGKLVRVIKGAVLDVAVDIRKNSSTYGKHYAVELSESNFNMLWIPAGFAHGFLTLEDETIFSYKCTDVYHPESEGGLMWNDKDININWPVTDPELSGKDQQNETLANFNSPF